MITLTDINTIKKMVRADLKGLVPYDPHVVPGVIKLDANENPFDFPPQVKEYIWDSLNNGRFNRYPDPTAKQLRMELSRFTGVPAEGIIMGNGSDELILNLMLTFGTGKEVLIASPTFSMYRIHAQVAGARWREVPRRANFELDTEALAGAAAGPEVNIIFICSPNNPTGNAVSPGDIEELLGNTSALVVVDEAYIEFGGESCAGLLTGNPNLIILRTFSKAFGLAGLRVGYLLAHPEVVEELMRIKQPYNLNTFSQIVAGAALKYSDAFTRQVELIRKNRDVLLEELKSIPGVEVFPTAANFILFRTPLAAREVFKGLLDNGVLIRDVSGPAMEKCLRVSVGTREENDNFLEKLRLLLKV